MDSCELFSRWQKRARSCTVGKSSVSACNVIQEDQSCFTPLDAGLASRETSWWVSAGPDSCRGLQLILVFARNVVQWCISSVGSGST